MSKAILFVNIRKLNTQALADEIRLELDKRNFNTDIFTFEGEPEFQNKYDIAFSLGGDGTVLYTARAMAPLGVPVIPINMGTLGFIAAISPEKWKFVFDSWLENKASLSRRLMLEALVKRGDRELFRLNCLNDIVISASRGAKMIQLQVFFSNGGSLIKLGQYRSDGLIIATPTGSTAYSVAAGGPVLDPELDAMIINPICPFTLSYRPIVLPAKEIIIVEVEKEQRSGIFLTVDGQVTHSIEEEDQVFITSLSHRVMLVSSDRSAFYQALRSKFSWLENPAKELLSKDGISHA